MKIMDRSKPGTKPPIAQTSSVRDNEEISYFQRDAEGNIPINSIEFSSHKKCRGFTLVELMAAVTILLLLTSLALPVAYIKVKRKKEIDLRQSLRTMREAIDRHKDAADQGLIKVKEDSFGYPSDLKALAEGVEIEGKNVKLKLLRKIPIDPMTGKARWGMRSIQDDPNSLSWGGGNVFDVYSRSTNEALDGTRYSDW